MTPARLNQLLHRTNRLARLVDVARASLAAVAVLLLFALVVVAVDAVLGLSPMGLRVLQGALALAAVLAAGYVFRWVLAHRFNPRRVAVFLEKRLGIEHNELITAVDFAQGEPTGSRELAQKAVERGDALAGELVPNKAIDRRPLRRAGFFAGGALLVVASAYLAVPRVFHAVVPRLLDPWGDHPPFTLVEFDVTVAPDRIYYGKSAEIRVRLSGPVVPRQANVVFVDEQAVTRQQIARPSWPGESAGVLHDFPDSATATPSSKDTAGQAFPGGHGTHAVPMRRTSAPAVVPASYQPGHHQAQDVQPAESPDAAYFALRLDRAQRSRTFYIDTPQGRSKRYTLEVVPVPLFEQVEVDYAYPAYTQWEADGGPLGSQGIRALEGTQITVTVTSNIALGGGTISLQPPHEPGEASSAAPAQPARTVPFQPAPDNPRQARGTFTLEGDGTFELAIVGTDETPGERTVRGALISLPDQGPRVDITEPAQRVVVPEGWDVAVVVAAQDDVGVGRMVVQRLVNGWGPSPIELAPEYRDPTYALAFYTFKLGDLGAVAGDVVTYYATAWDNHPSGEHFADTPIHAIQVISMEEYKQYARTRYHVEDMQAEWERFERELAELAQQREALLEELAELEERLANGEALTPEEQQRLEDLRQQLDQLAHDAQQLANQMQERIDQEQLYAFEEGYKEHLKELVQQLEEQAQDAQALSESAKQLQNQDVPANRQTFIQGSKKLQQNTKPFDQPQQEQREQVEEDLERLRMAGELMNQKELIEALIVQQRDLATRMSEFRSQPQLAQADQARAQQMAQEQRELQRELQEAQQRMAELGEQAQEMLPNMSQAARNIAQAIEGLDVGADQEAAAEAAEGGRGQQAHQAADLAARKLESLLGECKGMGGQGESDLDGCLGLSKDSAGQAMQQMAQGQSLPGTGSKPGGDGYSVGGSMARTAVVGPSVGLPGDSDADQRGAGQAGQGSQGQGTETLASQAESLTPQAMGNRQAGSGVKPAVPTRFQDLTHAYFKRLAEEKRGEDDVESER